MPVLTIEHIESSPYYDHVDEIEQAIREDSERIRQNAASVRDVLERARQKLD